MPLETEPREDGTVYKPDPEMLLNLSGPERNLDLRQTKMDISICLVINVHQK